MSKIKVILTDLDGVLRTFPSAHGEDIERELGLESGTFLPIAFQRQFLEPVITGKITDAKWRELIVEALSEKFDPEKVAGVVSRWSAFPGLLATEVHQIYRENQGECKIALLTNATTKLNADLRTLEVFDLFDFIFNTSEIGYAKPDRRAFEHVLDTIKIPPQEILFVDDRAENIEAARSLGFQVHLFLEHQALREALI